MSLASVVRLLLALGATSLVGWAAGLLLVSGLRRAERWAWSFGVGLLVQSSILALAYAVKAPPRPFLLAGDLLLFAAGILLRRTRRQRQAPEERSRWQPLALILLAAAGAAWLVFAVTAAAEPMWSTDYLAIWGLKGRTIYETGSVPARLFHDPALYWAHREYPLLVPLALAALATLAGEWNDQALALLFPAAALATLALLYGFLSRRVSRIAGAAAASLSALCFRLYHPVNAGTAEIPFALGAVLAACAFLDVRDRNIPQARGRLALAALFCASTKQEGTLWIALLAVLFLVTHGIRGWKREDWKAIGALVAPLALHGSLLYLLRGPQSSRDFDLRLFEPSRWPELLSRFAAVGARIATTEIHEAALPLAAIALFLLVTRRSFADVLLLAIGAQIFFYCLAFSVSSFDPMYAVDSALRRLVLTLFPALTLVLAARLAASSAREGEAPA